MIDSIVYLKVLNLINILVLFRLAMHKFMYLRTTENLGYLLPTVVLKKITKYNLVALMWFVSNFVSLLFSNQLFQLLTFLFMTILSNYIFIYLRNDSIGRGMGAPGYFTYFSNLIGLFCSLGIITGNFFLIKWLLQGIVVLLGAIFVVSGIYKLNSGYTYKASFGLNVGLCNEMWTNKWSWFAKIPPKSALFRISQIISTWGEIFGGACLVSGALAPIGSLILIVMFIGVGIFVRLGMLVPQIIFCLFLPLVDFGLLHDLDDRFKWPLMFFACIFFIFILGELLSYLFFLKQVKIINIKAIEVLRFLAVFYSKYFGTILWRVFTPDITSLHINVFSVDANGKRIKLSEWNKRQCFRYRYVGEAITVVSIFTTLRYWPSDNKLFHRRLLDYVKTLRLKLINQVDFEVSRIKVGINGSSLELVSVFQINVSSNEIKEIQVSKDYDLRKPEKFSALQSGAKIGEYGHEAD